MATFSPTSMAMGVKLGAGHPEDEAAARGRRPHRSTLSSPEPDAAQHQRGRKRRRSPLPFPLAMAAPVSMAGTTSGGSSVFRGRRRHRSTSLIAGDLPSRNASARGPREDNNVGSGSGSGSGEHSPTQRKRLVRPVHAVPIAEMMTRQHRRRSQSPSRSRSPHWAGDMTPPQQLRRRQRTKSRSRPHRNITFSGPDLKSRLQFELVVGGRESAGEKQG